jgi:DNA-binding response OmpR family regulator
MTLRRLTPAERIIAWRLASGRFISYDELNAALYADPHDVSPTSIKVSISRLREALHDTGLTITTQHGQGIVMEGSVSV